MTESLHIALLRVTFSAAVINATVVLVDRIVSCMIAIHIVRLSRGDDFSFPIQRISYMLKNKKYISLLLFPARSADYNFTVCIAPYIV